MDACQPSIPARRPPFQAESGRFRRHFAEKMWDSRALGLEGCEIPSCLHFQEARDRFLKRNRAFTQQCEALMLPSSSPIPQESMLLEQVSQALVCGNVGQGARPLVGPVGPEVRKSEENGHPSWPMSKWKQNFSKFSKFFVSGCTTCRGGVSHEWRGGCKS